MWRVQPDLRANKALRGIVRDTAIAGHHPVRIAILCAICLGLEGYDNGALGFAIPSLSAAWHLHPADFTRTLVIGSFGLLIGALTAGLLGDLIRRRTVLIACVVVFGACSLLMALAANPSELAVLRFLVGTGLGGALPLAVAITTDFSPPGRQGLLVTLMGCGFPLGGVIGGVIASQLIGAYGWPSIFILGGVAPLAIVPALLAWLPDRVPDLATARHLRGPWKNPIAGLFSQGYAIRTILLWIVFIANFVTTYFVSSWLPSILHADGYTPANAILVTEMFQVGGIGGTILVGRLLDGLGAERVLTCSLSVAAIFTVALGLQALSVPVTALVVLGIGLGVAGSQNGMDALAGATYPAEIRSTGTGWALGIGRIGSIGGSLLGGSLLALGWAPRTTILTAAIPLAIAVAAMATLAVLRARDPLPSLRAGTDAAVLESMK